MSSLVLRIATRFLQPLLLLFAIFLLLRGHNEPGGGFVGGLMAATAFALQVIAEGAEPARRTLRARPETIMGIGLALALVSASAALVRGLPFMSAGWTSLDIGRAHVELGTPLLFDLGVFLVVLGVTLAIIFSLSEEV